jgi:hypothetical protein
MSESQLSSPDSKFGGSPNKPTKIRFAPGVKGAPGPNSQAGTKYSRTGAKPEKKWTRPILSDEHE